MGDAGLAADEVANLAALDREDGPIREVHVLVTGFGPFNSFTTNPSWLIASALPQTLDAQLPIPYIESAQPQQLPPRNPLAALLSVSSNQITSRPQTPLRRPNNTPYRIHIHTHPEPLRVAYDSTSTTIPSLLNPLTNPGHISYDYVLHIGLASGRDSYTLETQAHRDRYVIADIDGLPGFLAGEKVWRSLNVPERLDVGWESSDVLRRWVAEVERRQAEKSEPEHTSPTMGEEARRFATSHGISGIRGGTRISVPRKAVVKLSRDAGRFLCEFILMCSLAWRWREGTAASSSQGQDADSRREKIGKVAFLHVPNGIEAVDVKKGVMVAESAIQSVVASWEAGYRNPLVYAPLSDALSDKAFVEQQKLNEKAVAAETAGFETKGTGDAIPTV